ARARTPRPSSESARRSCPHLPNEVGMQTETLRLAELALHALGDAVAIDANLVARAEQLEAELEGLLALARLIDELRQIEVRRDRHQPLVEELAADDAHALDVAGRIVGERVADVDAAATRALGATPAYELGGDVVQPVEHLHVCLARVVATIVDAPRAVLLAALLEAREQRFADLSLVDGERGDTAADPHALREATGHLERAASVRERPVRSRAIDAE